MGALPYHAIMKIRIYIYSLVAILFSSLTCCGSMGPNSVRAGRMEYNKALARSHSEQLLLNIVKMRFLDRPAFLDVSSMTSNLSFQTELSTTTTGIFNNAAFPTSANPSFTWKDNPTITYEELTGTEFVTQMLSPIPADTIVLLLQSWPADLLLPIALNEINNINNHWNPINPNLTVYAKNNQEKFEEVARVMRELNDQRSLEWSVRRPSDSSSKTIDTAILLNRHEDAKTKSLVNSLLSDLGLKQEKVGTTVFTVEYGLETKNDSTIIFGTRCMQDVLAYASRSVEIPDHMQELAMRIDSKWTANSKFRIRTSSHELNNASVAISYKDQWFYIADDDLDSKAYFLLIELLMDMQSGASSTGAPVLTIPIN